MKAIRPSMKENKRYLFLKGKDLEKNVEKAILEYIGALGMAKACPKFINITQNKGILSINRESLNDVKASFIVYDKEIQISKVSGTLKGLK